MLKYKFSMNYKLNIIINDIPHSYRQMAGLLIYFKSRLPAWPATGPNSMTCNISNYKFGAGGDGVGLYSPPASGIFPFKIGGGRAAQPTHKRLAFPTYRIKTKHIKQNSYSH